MSERTWTKQAVGHVGEGRHLVTIASRFDPETFEQIRAIAAERKISTSAVIRELVEFGLIDAEIAA